MTSPFFPLLFTAAALGGCIAAAIVWIIAWRGRCAETGWRTLLREADRATCFVFDDTTLLDSTASAAELLATEPDGDADDWTRLSRALRPRFSTFPDTPDPVRLSGYIDIRTDALAANAHVTAEWRGGIIRVCLIDDCTDAQASAALRHRLHVLEAEVATLRQAVQNAPYPVWQASDTGSVTWANRAYRALAAKLGFEDEQPRERIPQLFELPESDLDSSNTRMSVAAGDQLYWFDVSSTPIDDGRMNYAIDVKAVVNAEVAQRNFVQTLAKTFAQLSIGLAIFDRTRQLALFNPALTDLTGLSAEFLSGRPDLLSLFDQMRDRHMIPEPRNYATWREEISDVVAAAADGRYQDTWSLPSGLTYRVTGRPHPDGAIAFLFEDISAEVASTRRYRAQLELGQSMMDRLDQAIAVFSPNGVLNFCNLPYRELWRIDPDSSFAEMTLTDCVNHWRRQCRATPAWARMQTFFSDPGATDDWYGEVCLTSGDTLACRAVPLNHGATMIAFHRTQAAQARNLAQING